MPKLKIDPELKFIVGKYLLITLMCLLGIILGLVAYSIVTK
jgi:hypothetical protein